MQKRTKRLDNMATVHTAGHVIQPFQIVAEAFSIRYMGPKLSVNPPLTALWKSSYFLIVFHVWWYL